jgi:hypothetical protein
MANERLTNDQLQFFLENGYLLLKDILNKDKCETFDQDIVQPALLKYAGIDQYDPHTWSTALTKTMATGDYDILDSNPTILPGVMVRRVQENGADPISDHDSLGLDLVSLNPILDQLHCTPVMKINRSGMGRGEGDDLGNNEQRKDWEWIHHNVGWIHVRFPLHVDDVLSSKQQKMKTFHVDGGHFTPHFLDSPEQSIIVLPMIRPVSIGGGNTLILKKSHIYMTQQLAKAGLSGIPRHVTQDANDVANLWPQHLVIEMAPCDAGDVLLMHPFLIHGAGQAITGHPLRIAFNLGVKWNKHPIINGYSNGNGDDDNDDRKSNADSSLEDEERLSWVERSIAWALQQSTGFMESV